MAAFNWRSIYRIIKNQRSPEIEESGRVYSAEYASLLGASALCLKYVRQANIEVTLKILRARTLRQLIEPMAEQMVGAIGAYAFLFPQAVPKKVYTYAELVTIGQTPPEEAKGPVIYSYKLVGNLLSNKGSVVGGVRFE